MKTASFFPRASRALALAIALAAAAPIAAQAAEPVRLTLAPGDQRGAAKAVLRLEKPMAIKSFTLTEGRARLVLDLPRPVRIGGAVSGRGPGAGPVLAYRFAPRGSGARIVFDLAGPKVAADVATRKGAIQIAFEDTAVVGRRMGKSDLARSDRPAPPAGAMEPPRPEPAPGAIVQAAAPKIRKTVVVDAGHGGRDSGAVGVSGAFEKDVTLAAARALRDALEARGLDVVLTRDGDEFLELSERVRRARAAGADLFISLHADSSPNRSAEGASIYTLSERGGARAKTVAQAQDWELEIAEPPKSSQVHDILLDLAQRETKNRSAEFAQVAVRHLHPVAPLLPNAKRNAGFFVLLAPDVPAILLEMGFMTNGADETRLTNADRRRKMMDALADAAAEFLAAPTTFADAR